MKYKLVFVEGLPGTGKSTLSEKIFHLLTEQGISSELLLEDNEKIPSNFYDISGIPKNDFANFRPFDAVIKKTKNYVFVNLKNCEEEAKKKLSRYDLGNEFNKFISAQEYARCTLEWWRNWVANCLDEKVLVMDSAFMQCPINEMIFRGSNHSAVVSYIQAIAEIIRPHHPICIYLRRENAKIAIDFAKAVKGERWATGIEGLTQSDFPDLFERRFALEQSLLSLIPGIVCNINGNDWTDAEIKIQKLIV